MKRYICLLVCLLGWMPSAYAQDESSYERSNWHLNVGAGVNAFFINGFDDVNETISNRGYGGVVSMDWQGDGLFGVRVPLSYFHHFGSDNAGAFIFGADWMVHFTKRDRKIDPYAFLGMEFIGGHSDGHWLMTPIPFAKIGVGVRHPVSKRMSLYAEASLSTFFLVNRVAATTGISIAF